MNTTINVLRYSAKLLLLLSVFFWGIPNSQATSYRELASQREISASELLPVKPKAKSVKKVKKIKKGHKKLEMEVTDAGWFFVFGIVAILGAVLFGFGVGFGIFGLWLSGLIAFGLFNLLNCTLVYNTSYSQSLELAIILFFVVLSNIVLFLGFLLWGLIAAVPIVWITGLAAFVFAVVQFFVALNLG